MKCRRSGLYSGVATPVVQGGKVTDVKIEYPTNFAQQMLDFGKKYSLLPDYN